MKKLNDVFIAFLITLLFTSCFENKHLESKIVKTEKEIIYLTGKVVNIEASLAVDSSGGIYKSSDNFFTIEFPKGCLSSVHFLNIEKITNTNPSGIGSGYRISPSNIEMKYPVKITFNYANQDLISSPEVLLLARQDNDNRWNAVGGTKLDKNQTTLSIETFQLGDWVLCEALQFPKSIIIKPGDEINWTGYQYINLGNKIPFGKSIPLGHEVAMKKMESEINLQGVLQGEGLLTKKNRNLYYKAPSTLPKTNPVILKTYIPSSDIYFFSEITVANEGVTYRINDGDWHYAPALVAGNIAGINQISGPINLPEPGELSIFWKEESNMMVWENDFPQFRLIAEKLQYFHFYVSGENPIASPGNLQIFSNENSNKFISGKFLIEKAGIYDMQILEGNPYTGTAKIEGHFILKY